MCEYCGCEDVAAIAALTAEHDELRGVSREAAHAACGGDRTAAAAAGRLLTLLHPLHPLHPHTEIEGRALCAGKAGEFAEHVASLREDHCRIDATLILVADPGVAMESWERDLEIYGRRARTDAQASYDQAIGRFPV